MAKTAKEVIDNAIAQNLTEINLANMGLSAVPSDICKCKCATRIDLSNNLISSLPNSFNSLKSLFDLNLGNNKFNAFPYILTELTSLNELSLNDNGITHIPPGIDKLCGLKSLDLSNNNIEIFSEDLSNLENLEVLNLVNNNISLLPSSIAKLKKLKKLLISSNSLNRLTSVIGGLSSLQVLDVRSNDIAELEKTMLRMSSLQELNLADNKIKALPDEIGNLKSLIKLHLSNNKLSSIPKSVGNLSNLEIIELDDNQITDLPDSLSALKNLTNLTLTRNSLSRLPSSYSSLSNLRILILDKNNFQELPPFLPDLNNLEMLSASSNKISVLPDVFHSLTALRSMYIDNNNVSELPKSLCELHLNMLFLHENRELGLPAELLGPTWEDVFTKTLSPAKPSEIFSYYLKVRGGRRPLNEAKLILVGRGGVGKTSLVNVLVHKKFKKTVKTEGINITDWNIVINNNEDIALNIWDFGGQEIMHATHQFFLTQRSLYVLVITGREGVEDADTEYWLKLIDSFGNGSPVIVVLNKVEEHNFDVNRRALQLKYPIVKSFVKTDCVKGTGISELRDIIMKETDKLRHLRDSFPASWFAIKHKLSSMRKNFLSFENYRKICSNLSEKDPAAQELLASYLHSLGIVLNYKEDPRLQDTHVLNPHWVTNGIYAILNSSVLEVQKGEVSLQDLDKILDDKRYPANMHRFIIDLMKKFDLCFTVSDDECRYLVPELLDKQEHHDAAKFNTTDCLNFQYEYYVLPEGLLPRFIVRSRSLSHDLPRWRTGVILKFETNTALVKADVQERKVYISVSGPVAGRRRLLAIIRADLERIHADIKNLNPTAIVPLPKYPNETIPYNELVVLESKGLKNNYKVIGTQAIQYDVVELLNGVDLDGVRRRDKAVEDKFLAKVFISYCHKDEALKNELETHLKILQHSGYVDIWHDRKIDAGTEWKHQIDTHLETADIIVLLVSSDFIASSYCYEREMKHAMSKHEKGTAKVIPVIVRDVNWNLAPFSKLQALPKDAMPVVKWNDKDSAWKNVSEGIQAVIEKGRKSKGVTLE